MGHQRLVECVPNFSEGRNAALVDRLASAIRSVPGALVLDVEMDADHNRSVITFVAPPEIVVEAALAAAEIAVATIDLNHHQGVHPRIGALDVLPFVPLEGVTLEDCVGLARKAAAALWKRHQVPSYFYEAAAARPERANLENIRRGQFEGLRQEVKDNPDRAPDTGGPDLHPTAGATVIGARKFLIAYNINLDTNDVDIARQIARKIRTSSGGFPNVKAMGLPLASRNVAQVSMNLTDFETTPVHKVFDAVAAEARERGVRVLGSELIGLIPKRALEMAANHYLKFENFDPSMVLENRVRAALEERSGLVQFFDALAAPTATPGGGSAAAAAGAMAAALGEMVARLSKLDASVFLKTREFLQEAVERDAAAYNAVVAAYRRPKEERAPFVAEAMRGATLVPLEVLEQVHELALALTRLKEESPAKFASDVVAGIALANAAREGATANVRINLEGLDDEAFRAAVLARIPAGAV